MPRTKKNNKKELTSNLKNTKDKLEKFIETAYGKYEKKTR